MATEFTPKQIEELLKRVSEFGGSPELASSAADMKTLTDALALLNDGNKLAAPYVEKLGEAMASLSEKVKELEDPLTKFDRSLKRTFKTLTGVTDASDTLVGSLFKMKSEGKSNKEVFEQFKKTANKTFSALNVGTSIVRKFAESSLLMGQEIDKATAAFNRSTGAGGVYNSQLRESERINRQFGISLAEIGASRQALMDGLSGYGGMQEDEQARLMGLGAQYTRLGVSTADFTGILQTGTRVLGETNAEMETSIEETRLLAQGLGISVPKALSDLNAALPKLAAFGDESVEIFQELEKQSQRTGLAVDELIGISSQFMTFDSAAESAGNLNAVLGTQMFDTMGLLEAQLQGPDSFVNYLESSLQGSIGNFEDLNVFQKQAIANASGLSVEQLAMMMNSKDAAAENTENQTSFNEAMASGRSLVEELTILAKGMAITLTPLFTYLGKAIGGINAGFGWMEEHMPFIAQIFKIIASGIAAAFAIGGITKFIGMMKTLLGITKSLGIANAVAGFFKNPLMGGLALAGGGVALAGAKKLFDSFQYGTTSASGKTALVNEAGLEGIQTRAMKAAGEAPVPIGPSGPIGSSGPIGPSGRAGTTIQPPKGSTIVRHEEFANATSGGSVLQAANAGAAAAVQAMGSMMNGLGASIGASVGKVVNDRPLVVHSTVEMEKKAFGSAVNKHFGAPGSQPA